ncbi:MAG: hypothetical protein ACP5PW_03265 [Candidatus Dormibacteria bacterium]
MSLRPRPAPYYLPLQFQPLPAYLSRGLSPARWAEEQFALAVRMGSGGDPLMAGREQEVLSVLDRLPLQVKDVLRGLIDQLHLDRGDAFSPGTLATWHRGVLRVNVDWPDLDPVVQLSQRPTLRRRFLLSTLVHECGHALVEDPRGGVSLREYVRLVAAGGWLPRPTEDRWPYLAGNGSLEHLERHYLERLRALDPRWDPELPVGDPRQPGPAVLDWQLGPPDPGFPAPFGQSLRLQPASRIALSIMAERRGAAGLAERSRLTVHELRGTLDRHPSVSPYAENEPCESLAEIFRCLQLEHPSRTLPALEEGWRVLISPWREAEIEMGPRAAALPWAGERPVSQLRGRA